MWSLKQMKFIDYRGLPMDGLATLCMMHSYKCKHQKMQRL